MENKIKNINDNLEYYTSRIQNYLGTQQNTTSFQKIPLEKTFENKEILNSIKNISAQKKNIFKKNDVQFEPEILINQVIEEEISNNFNEEYEYEIMKHNDLEEKIKLTQNNLNKLMRKQEKKTIIQDIENKILLPKFCPDKIEEGYMKYMNKDILKENNFYKNNSDDTKAEKFLMVVLAEEMNSFKKRKNKYLETIYENEEKIEKLKNIIKKKKLKLKGERKTVKKGKRKLKDLISRNIDLLKILKKC